MKFLVAFALAVACAHADVSHVVNSGADYTAQVLKSETEVNPDSFHYAYETSNGIYANANGVVKDVKAEYPAQEVRGEYKYTGPDNVVYAITYTADENGYQPQGAHLPVPPPVPEQIARALAWIEAHPQADDKYVNTGARAAASASSVPVVPVSKPFGKPVAPGRRF